MNYLKLRIQKHISLCWFPIVVWFESKLLAFKSPSHLTLPSTLYSPCSVAIHLTSVGPFCPLSGPAWLLRLCSCWGHSSYVPSSPRQADYTLVINHGKQLSLLGLFEEYRHKFILVSLWFSLVPLWFIYSFCHIRVTERRKKHKKQLNSQRQVYSGK